MTLDLDALTAAIGRMVPGEIRVGRHVGRTIYRHDELIGVMDAMTDAACIVALVNAATELIAIAREHAALTRALQISKENIDRIVSQLLDD